MKQGKRLDSSQYTTRKVSIRISRKIYTLARLAKFFASLDRSKNIKRPLEAFLERAKQFRDMIMELSVSLESQLTLQILTLRSEWDRDRSVRNGYRIIRRYYNECCGFVLSFRIQSSLRNPRTWNESISSKAARFVDSVNCFTTARSITSLHYVKLAAVCYVHRARKCTVNVSEKLHNNPSVETHGLAIFIYTKLRRCAYTRNYAYVCIRAHVCISVRECGYRKLNTFKRLRNILVDTTFSPTHMEFRNAGKWASNKRFRLRNDVFGE